jgi:hypothetical protein
MFEKIPDIVIDDDYRQQHSGKIAKTYFTLTCYFAKEDDR